MAKSDFLENNLIKHIFRTGSYTKPTQLNVALFTVAPSDTGGGTECTGGSYARVNVAPSDSNWAATSGTNGTTSNASTVTFPTPSASWGSVVAFGIFDESDNLLYYGNLGTAKTVNNGDPAPKFNANQLQIQES